MGRLRGTGAVPALPARPGCASGHDRASGYPDRGELTGFAREPFEDGATDGPFQAAAALPAENIVRPHSDMAARCGLSLFRPEPTPTAICFHDAMAESTVDRCRTEV